MLRKAHKRKMLAMVSALRTVVYWEATRFNFLKATALLAVLFYEGLI